MKDETLKTNEQRPLNKHGVIGSAVLWSSPTSSDGERTLAQHAFVSKLRGKWWGDKYEGNVALCSRMGIADENERFIPLAEIEAENFDETKACKRCTLIARQRHYL